jgi:hypothetical protein
MIADIQTGQPNGDLVRSLPVKALPTSANGWPPRPFQIVSLFDVIQFPADQFLRASGLVASMSAGLKHTLQEAAPTLTLSDHTREALGEQLELIKKLFTLVGLTYSIDEINFILTKSLTDPKETYATFCALLDSLARRMSDEAKRKTYLYMPPDDSKYYYDPNVRSSKRSFSDRLANAFPSAVDDLTKGTQAYATGCDTACVFHMMRAVEHGLRAMAQTLKVRFPGKPGKPPKAIEFQQWGDVITEIGKKVTAMENKPRTKKRDVDLVFYGEAASQFHYFKTSWRNHVMHSRTFYEHDDAAIVMRHTVEFMEHISGRLKERSVK